MAVIQVPADGVGKRVDTVTLTDALVEVHRQKIVLTGGSGTAEVCVVTNAAPAATDMGLVVRQAGTASVVLAAGTANFGTINNISANVSVNPVNISTMPAVVLAAGTANIGTIQAISANVSVNPVNISTMPAVVLAAGAANIGTINNISATVLAACTGTFNLSGTAVVSGVVGIVAGAANIGSINNISATVTVAGVVGLTAGTANIGSINNISATVNVAIATPFTVNNISATVTVAFGNIAIMSTSHGPKSVVVSTSAAVTLITGPGAGLSVYITQLAVTNGGTVGGLARTGSSASPSTILMFCASAGGGFVMNFDPPWKLSASEAALCSIKPNTVGNAYFNVNFYVAP